MVETSSVISECPSMNYTEQGSVVELEASEDLSTKERFELWLNLQPTNCDPFGAHGLLAMEESGSVRSL